MNSLLKNKYDLVVALDPATASFGFAVYDTASMEVVTVKEFKALGKDLRVRIKSMSVQLANEFKKLEAMNVEYIIFCEQFVMVGKGGEALQRMIGAAMAISPGHRPFEHVNNLQVKAYVGGTGKADKAQVAAGLRQFFPQDVVVEELIQGHRYDATDALAIGVTGYEKYVLKTGLAKKKTKTRKKLRNYERKNSKQKSLKKSSSTLVGKTRNRSV